MSTFQGCHNSQTTKEGSIVVFATNEDILKILDFTITHEVGVLETLDFDKKEVSKGSESSAS